MRIIACLIIVALFATTAFSAENKIELSSGQTVYVPVYSNVFTGPKELPFNLAATLSIRNTDLHNPITITSVQYFDTNGKLLKEYVKNPITLGPLGSTHFSIKESDEAGGFGANFIVRWKAAKDVNPPIVESVMIGAKSGQGISFVSRGTAVSDDTK